jgi:cytochrome P450
MHHSLEQELCWSMLWMRNFMLWMRKTMEGGFTEKAIAKQEGIVRGYVDLLIERLREKVRKAGPEDAGEAIVDIVK